MKHLKPLFSYINSLDTEHNYEEGYNISFIEMHTLHREVQELAPRHDGLREFLSFLACKNLKPVLSDSGFRLVPLSQHKNMLTIPTCYNFAKSPFVTSPVNCTKSHIYPLLDFDFDMYYAHSLRWFPWTNNHNIPVRFKSMRLSEVGQEKVYIDVPCVTRTDSHLQFVRVSQLVFDKLYYLAHKKKSFVQCERRSERGSMHTDLTLCGECPDFVIQNSETLSNTAYMDYHRKAEHFIENQHEHGVTSRSVADFLIHL